MNKSKIPTPKSSFFEVEVKREKNRKGLTGKSADKTEFISGRTKSPENKFKREIEGSSLKLQNKLLAILYY